MNPRPTGRMVGNALTLTRRFRAPIEDVWTSVTVSESTARWIGPWEGEPGVGKPIRFQMTHEQGAPWSDATIEACEAPRHLIVTSHGDYGARLELTLTQTGDTTELVFVHHLADRTMAGDYGPGWEYYLDALVASRDGAPRPDFADYHPSQQAYYLEA